MPVVAVPEEIDITNAPGLRSALLEAAAHGPGALVADMTRTRFCDCAGLHTLLAAHTRAQAEGGGLLLVIRGTSVLRVFELTGLDRVIPSFTSLDEALSRTSADGSSANAYCALWRLQPPSDHDRPCVAVVGRSLSYVDRTSHSSEPHSTPAPCCPWNSPRDP